MNRVHIKPGARQRRVRGFTLLEIMISLVVLAIGIMGIIGLQISTYKQLQTSHNFSKASMLASDMADRMLANKGQVLLGAYTHNAPPTEKPSPDCAVADCTPVQLAAYDVWYWQEELNAADPEDGVKRVPGALPMASGEVRKNDEDHYLILVRWDDDMNGSIGEECAALDPDAVQNPDDLDCYALDLGCLSEVCP